MARAAVEERSITVPEGVSASLQGKTLTVRGPLGELNRDFSSLPVQVEVLKDKVVVRSYWARRREKAFVGTAITHVKNMINGVVKGYVYKLKVVSSHFPMSIKTLQNKVLIENFIGERSPRVAEIVGNAKVTVKGDEIQVHGLSLEEVSQTAANIQKATEIKKKDPRVFLDGVYVYERAEGMQVVKG